MITLQWWEVLANCLIAFFALNWAYVRGQRSMLKHCNDLLGKSPRLCAHNFGTVYDHKTQIRTCMNCDAVVRS